MAHPSEQNIKINIPFCSPESAKLACDVLSVDKELGTGVKRKITTNEGNLLLEFRGSELKKLRVAVNSILNSILLIVKTLNQFESK